MATPHIDDTITHYTDNPFPRRSLAILNNHGIHTWRDLYEPFARGEVLGMPGIGMITIRALSKNLAACDWPLSPHSG